MRLLGPFWWPMTQQELKWGPQTRPLVSRENCSDQYPESIQTTTRTTTSGLRLPADKTRKSSDGQVAQKSVWLELSTWRKVRGFCASLLKLDARQRHIEAGNVKREKENQLRTIYWRATWESETSKSVFNFNDNFGHCCLFRLFKLFELFELSSLSSRMWIWRAVLVVVAIIVLLAPPRAV